jgi:hypothetical protein
VSDCLFCAIASGDHPAEIVLADDVVVAFLDSRPVFKGHVLVSPRDHYETLPDLPAELVGPLFTRMYTWCPGRGATACAVSSGRARGTPTRPRRRRTRGGSGARSPQAADRPAGCATVTPVCLLTAAVLDLSWSRLFQNGQA